MTDLIARLERIAQYFEGDGGWWADTVREAITAISGQGQCNKCGHVLAATYGTKGCQLPICAGDREDAARRR